MSNIIHQEFSIGDKRLVIFNWSYLVDTDPPALGDNVELIDSSGNTVWRVNGMEDCKYWDMSFDFFVGATNNSGEWLLHSAGGNIYSLDVNSGKVVYNRFVK